MDVSTFSAAFCVTLSLMLAHCASDAVTPRISDHLQQADDHHLKFWCSVPRKLILEEQPMTLKSSTHKEEVPHKKYLIKASSGQQINKGHEKQKNVIRKGTWREWMEGPDKSEYFTMDYHWVRRRRPIHNQQIPFVP